MDSKGQDRISDWEFWEPKNVIVQAQKGQVKE
jgi:hypothetical protein